MAQFKVGDKVIAITNHSEFVFKKGEEFIVRGVSNTPCCNQPLIDIGIHSGKGRLRCTDCNHIYPSNGRPLFYSRAFAPIQTQYTSQSALMELAVTFKEIIERSDCPVVTPEKIKA